MGRIGARQHQFARQRESVLVRSLKHKRSRIGHQRRVKARRDFRRERRTRFARQAKHHLCRGYRMRIDPVHVREGPSADVMIDADQKAVLQALQPRAVDAVTFQNDRGFVIPAHAIGLQHLIRKGQGTINSRDAIMQHHIGLLAHGAQNLAAGQRRSDGISIGARMRRKHEPV